MTTNEFTEKLKEVGINKKQFAQKVGMVYQSVTNWDDDDKPIPAWVESWLENYRVRKDFEKIVETISPYIPKDLPNK